MVGAGLNCSISLNLKHEGSVALLDLRGTGTLVLLVLYNIVVQVMPLNYMSKFVTTQAFQTKAFMPLNINTTEQP